MGPIPKRVSYMDQDLTVEELRQEILERYSRLSKRLQQVGKYVIDSQNDFAIETVAEIAARCGVQPSAVVRFAKEFGFDGASSMQRLFREELISNKATLSYRERVRKASPKKARSERAGTELLGGEYYEFLENSVASIQQLSEPGAVAKVERFAQMIRESDCVYLAGVRRSFPVVSYLSYALSKAGKRNVLLDCAGSIGKEMINCISKNDLMLATSFNPYGEETVAACQVAARKEAKIALISDSEISPIANDAHQAIFLKEPEIFGFRSLSSAFCLAQTIIVAFILLSEQN